MDVNCAVHNFKTMNGFEVKKKTSVNMWKLVWTKGIINLTKKTGFTLVIFENNNILPVLPLLTQQKCQLYISQLISHFCESLCKCIQFQKRRYYSFQIKLFFLHCTHWFKEKLCLLWWYLYNTYILHCTTLINTLYKFKHVFYKLLTRCEPWEVTRIIDNNLI